MKNRILFLFAAVLFLTTGLNAQLFEKYSVGVGATFSTSPGLRVEAATSLTNHLNLRAAFIFIPTELKFSYNISGEKFGVDLSKNDKLKDLEPAVNFSVVASPYSGQLLVDFTPIKDGWFHLTAGLVFGGSSLTAKGVLLDEVSKNNLFDEIKKLDPDFKLKDFEHEGMKLRVGEDSSVSAVVYTGGNTIKPYLGLGVGRAIPRSRVGFKAELGLLYTGGIKMSSSNILDEKGDVFNRKDITPIIVKFVPEIEKHQAFFRWSPVFNLQLQVRLN